MEQQNSLVGINIQQPASNDIVSTDELLGAIEYSKTMINPMEIKGQNNIDSVIIQGFSGVGKSSMILTLSGQPIIAYHHPKTGVPTLATRDPEGKRGVRIEQKIQAGTIYPACSQLNKQIAKKGDLVMLWDMPGIGQNRGLTQSLINSYFYTRIFQLQQSIKIVFAINHTDLDYSMKGINIERSFTDFLKMFGAITPFQSSVLFVITKAPVHFRSENAIECFKDILKLAFVKNNKSIYNLVERLSNGKIPIVIFRHPIFNNQEVNSASPQDVSQQYTSFVQEFYAAVKTLKPTREIKLNAPAMSTTERNKCSAFVTNTQNVINSDAVKLCGYLEVYLKETFLQRIEGNKNIRDSINSISIMRFFVRKFTDLINISANPKKQQLKSSVDKLNKHLISEQRKPFCVKSVNGDISCLLMQNLANNFIMVNFLNILSFHKQEKYAAINQIEVMKTFFNRLKDVNLSVKWNVYEQAFKKKFGEVIINLYQSHLKLWQSSQIYYHWKNNFKFFPSLVLRLSKFIKSKQQRGNFALNYFQQMANIEKSASLKSQPMEQINSLLRFSKKSLNLDLDQRIMTGNILPMLDRKQKELISKVIAFDKWQEATVELAISEYNLFTKPVMINGEEKKLISSNQAIQKQDFFKSSYISLKGENDKLLKNNNDLQADLSQKKKELIQKKAELDQKQDFFKSSYISLKGENDKLLKNNNDLQADLSQNKKELMKIKAELDQAKCCKQFWCCCCCCCKSNSNKT